jgi:hypothetical protein
MQTQLPDDEPTFTTTRREIQEVLQSSFFAMHLFAKFRLFRPSVPPVSVATRPFEFQLALTLPVTYGNSR